MRKHTAALFFLLVAPGLSWAAGPNPRLNLPDFSSVEKKASESVVITLDPAMLGLAAKFLGDDPEDAATKEVIKGLQGIYVRSYTFDKDFAYQHTDVDAIRAQLASPGWNRVMQTRSSKSRADVDIYIMLDRNQAIGLALIASEPRQFTVVNIIGAIDLDKLHRLEGQFGIPKLDADQSKPPATQK